MPSGINTSALELGSFTLALMGNIHPVLTHAGVHPCDGSRLYGPESYRSNRYWPNRYWSAELLEQRGCIVTVRFDPDHPESVRVYGAEGDFLCTAERLSPAGFDDTQAAGEHARARKTFMVEAERQATVAQGDKAV